ncbi:hypothetical protein D7V82_19575 [bacterium 1xD8-6]|nr:hypothetical protein D7V72_20415 [bacterium D16-36]RKI63791.1 hypothetical protein D7V82_19575 [bacterium 1xD8-6]
MHKGAYGDFRFIAYSVRSLSEVICIILLRGEEYRYFLIKRKPNYAATVLIGCLRLHCRHFARPAAYAG